MKNVLFVDSSAGRFLFKLGNLILLNLCYMLCCIPVITIGAATSALYAVVFRMDTDEEGRLIRSFFRTFANSFRQGTLIWLLLAVLTCGLLVTAWLLYLQGFPMILFLVPLLLLLMIGQYAFPLVGLFQNKLLQTITNALLLCLSSLFQSVLAVLITWLPLLLAIFIPRLFWRIGWLWYTMYFALAAYLNTKVLRKPFAPYLPWLSGDNKSNPYS